MARALRRAGLTLPLATLIALSTLLHWLAARRVPGIWIMPDEAIYGVRALGLWEHGSLPLVGRGSGYSVLYPIVAGGPLSVGSLSTGLAVLRPLQALLMSLAAWPVYAYVRRVAGDRSALAAAALTVALPLVLFSGFVMTEVLYYPLAAAALLAIVRAVETTARRDQVIALVLIAAAVLTRVQAVVLLFVFAAAIAVDAALRRRRPPLRAFAIVWSLTALAILVALAAPGAFGAYASALSGGYDAASSLKLVYYHLAYLILLVGVVPAAALVLLAVEAVRAREPDPVVTALVSVSVCACVLVVVQVGVFSSRYAPHLLERDLAALPPLLFCALALWFARGAPRRRLASSLTILGVLAVVLLAPWNDLIGWVAFPDSPGISLLLDSPVGWRPLTAITVVATMLLVLFRFAPQRTALMVVLLTLFVWNSVRASHLVETYAAGTQSVLVGEPRTWIDRTAPSDVVYVYAGDLASWPVVWEQRFWNERIDRVLSIAPHVVPGPIEQQQIPLPVNGYLPARERYAVADDWLTLVGDPLAHQDRGPNQYGLTLYRLSGRPRISTITSGVQPNGDMIGPATVTAYGCAGGTLDLTLLPKASRTISVTLDGREVVHADVAGKLSWNGSVTVPPDHGPAPCRFGISGGGLLLGSTRIDFRR